LRFRREERLGRLARACDPLAIVIERGVRLLPAVEQELSPIVWLLVISTHRSRCGH